MPANIAHMLIAHKALQKLKQKGVAEFTRFAEMLDDGSSNKRYKAYMNLGSIGPDLYYYESLASSAKDMLFEGFVQAKGVTPWSYHLHSSKPNEFVLKLVEILFSDAVRKNKKIVLDGDDIRKLAYIAGHLTHIAADQIIHPVVNGIAGPYYRSGQNRKEHRRCEVFQDYFLYQEVYRLENKAGKAYDFFEQSFNKWADCVRGSRNTKDWFRYFLQRAFAETYNMFPPEQEIEDSVDNLLLILKVCTARGPYREARKEYLRKKHARSQFHTYVKKPHYVKYYRLAVELAVVYLIGLYEVYFVLKEAKDFTDARRRRFLSIVSDADLSCPLKHDLYDKASEALESKKTMDKMVEQHSSPLLNAIEILPAKTVLESKSDKDILYA